MTTYVFQDVEVNLTGRTAARKSSSGKVDVLLEIAPADQSIMRWKKWVRQAELYVIDSVDGDWPANEQE